MFRVEGVEGPGKPLLLPGDPISSGAGGGGLGGMVGEITSTAWSFCFGQQIAFAHVWKDRASGSFLLKAPVLNAGPGSDAYKVHALTELTAPPLQAARAAE